MFGSSLDLDLLGIEIDDKTMIPGLSVASSRAQPLAGMVYRHLIISQSYCAFEHIQTNDSQQTPYSF